jgi:uncharacterized protein (TIGR03083 family)
VIDYIDAIRTESARFVDVIGNTRPEAAVPSCPGWSVADLTWHLLEVQYFWASIAAGLLQSPDTVADLVRPADDALPELFEQQTNRLINALANHDPSDVCWSWHDAGHSIGWIRRRQAHEALIHRADAELATGQPFTIDPTLAADGVDEVLTVMLDANDLPDWATFHPDGSTAVIEIDETTSWTMNLGRFTGTSPVSGNSYDDIALALTNSVSEPSAIMRGSPGDVDLWLWGRGSMDAIEVAGDSDIAARIRAIAAEGTQ